MAFILILVAVIVVAFFLIVFSDSKNNVKSHIKKLKDLPIEELEKISGSIVTAMILHDEAVNRVGKVQADRACKYEKYGCKKLFRGKNVSRSGGSGVRQKEK